MRYFSCLLGILLLTPGALGEGVQLTFAAPAVAGDEVTLADAQWMFIHVGSDDQFEMELDLPIGGEYRRTTYAVGEWYQQGLVGAFSDKAEIESPTWEQLDDGASLTLQFDGATGLLAIQATDIESRTSAPATLSVVHAGSEIWQSPATEGHPEAVEYGFFGHQVNDRSVAAVWDKGSASQELQVRGLQGLAWIGGALTCAHEGDCPSEDVIGAHVVDPGQGAKAEIVPFHEIRVMNGSVAGAGSSQFHLAYGGVVSIEAQDWLRLQGVRQAVTCESETCDEPDGRSLTVNGTIFLDDLQPAAGDAFTASAWSPDGSAFFDEEPVAFMALRSGAEVAVAAAVGVVGLGVVGKLLAGLFTKVGKRRTLGHPRRRILLDHIEENPGTNFREVMRETEIPAGTLRHHLNVMIREGLIMERQHGGTTRFFENHGKYDANWEHLVLLREEPLAILQDWICHHPGVIQSTILAEMAKHGWSRSSTQYRLGRLVDAGLVEVSAHGRRKSYEVQIGKQVPAGHAGVPVTVTG